MCARARGGRLVQPARRRPLAAGALQAGHSVEKGRSVIGDATMLNTVAVSIRMDNDVVGPQIVGDRVAGAAQIHRPHVANRSPWPPPGRFSWPLTADPRRRLGLLRPSRR
jgi:hypothetical protein